MEIEADTLAVASPAAETARDPRRPGPKPRTSREPPRRDGPCSPGPPSSPPGAPPALPSGTDALRAAFRQVGGEDGRAPVVRSSSAHEDTEDSSMAGRFESVLDVRGWDAFTAAVRRVQDSAARYLVVAPSPRAGTPGAAFPREAPRADADAAVPDPAADLADLAVLVQPMLTASAGGVMFGADPVEGRSDHMLTGAVSGGPDQLVDGSTLGVRHRLTRHGRLLHTEPDVPRGTGPLGHRARAQLVRTARRTERVFGGPQDVEFGFDADGGGLWLLQARPITAMAARPSRDARLLGPGPVVETLPTGSMTAAYLVRTGQATSRRAALRTVAVGPPSIEQVYYVLHVSHGDSDQPSGPVRGISRLLDAPRRITSSL